MDEVFVKLKKLLESDAGKGVELLCVNMDATIDDAISFLNAKSKEEDLPDHVGINFVVKQTIH